MAALGIGGEWAVGASLLSETWPSRWRPWMADGLQTGVNLGIMLAGLAIYILADFPPRSVFLVGILPALFYAGFLFLPAAVFAWLLPQPPDEGAADLTLTD